jgi:hypothetical protein
MRKKMCDLLRRNLLATSTGLVVNKQDGVTIQGKTMDSDHNVTQRGRSWESVHVCPNCDLAIDLAELDMTAVTTGILTCPRCDWSGRIEITVVDAARHKP